MMEISPCLLVATQKQSESILSVESPRSNEVKKLKQQGLTLIEMMIALILSLLVVATVMTIFFANVKSNSENIKMVMLNQDLRVAMRFIADEVKRAGYSASSANSTFIDELHVIPAVNCLLYSYDLNESGAVNGGERFGIKLDSGAIKWTNNRGTCATTDPSCCRSGTYNEITNTDLVTITSFSLTPTSISTATSTMIEHIDVAITGEVSLNPGTASRTIQETIRVRNDDAP